ncbi:MAG: DUF2892 domain-containing protein [Flavobacteriales bacterium]|nr:DUF2892 domain-containing protein [Flavobacteriales bacterium]
MKKNMGSVDRIVRIMLAVVFGVLYYTGVVSGTLGIVLLVLGAVFLLTALVNWCPIYAALGLRTRPKEQ